MQPEAGIKHDTGKLQWSLLPFEPLRAVLRVMAFGAHKYQRENWKLVVAGADGRRRYFDAAMRHLTAWWDVEAIDEDSGESQLACAVCCLLFLLWLDQQTKKEAA